jgi:hypothetical protein
VADTCFSGASLVLLGVIGGVLQMVIVTLFWLAIRSKDDSIKDARDLRDRALEVNEIAIRAGAQQAEQVGQVLPRRAGGRGRS